MFNKKLLILVGLLFGCTTQDHASITQRIVCTTTPDCAARGGSCINNQCRADNECTTAADCASGETCAPDPDFGGLCTSAGQPLAPLPAWSCTVGKDCPLGQGCASDGTCHVDGECHNAWQGEYLVGDCADASQICAASLDPLAGFCTDGRGGPDPYCRSTGAGECRSACATVDDCGTGATCTGGFCHASDECHQTSDCAPNHVCGVPENWDDYGYKWCLVDQNPTCHDDGHGACRLACVSSIDCLDGGGCGADHLCHASNECHADADCDPGLTCLASPEFGGLCGLDHTM
ncbi:hypothetical protein BH11MYX1_BH11MYX1_05390 [soil metagenome]